MILGILAASIYGTTYQQFRYFDLSDPRGANDSVSYIRMSHGDYQVTPVHRYRFMAPALAGALRPLIQTSVRDPGEQDKVSFYIKCDTIRGDVVHNAGCHLPRNIPKKPGNLWGSSESRSGVGSTESATRVLRDALPTLFAKHSIDSLLDDCRLRADRDNPGGPQGASSARPASARQDQIL